MRSAHGRWPKNPKVTGLTPLGRPDLRGCALWSRGVSGDVQPPNERHPGASPASCCLQCRRRSTLTGDVTSH
eukprot:3740580-Prymnesium_polylepis.1